MNDLYSIKLKAILAYLKTEDSLFWLINIYLFLEYIRPQALYPSIDVLPFAQIFLILTLLNYFLKRGISIVKNPLNLQIFLFFFVIILSSLFALDPNLAFDKWPAFIALMIAYFLISNIVNTEKRFLVFMLAFLLYSFKMSQHSFRGWARMGFGFSNWGTGGGPGWFHNSGEFGIQMCIFLPLATYFFISLNRNWPSWKKIFFLFFPFTALTGTISSSSRGALLGAGAVMLWILLKSRYKVKGLLIIAVCAFLVISILPPEQKARFQEAGSDRTSISRIDRWKRGLEMVSNYPILGVGYANWSKADRVLFGGDGALSHNIFIECMSELGYTGLSIFFLMIFFTFTTNYQTRKLSLAYSKNKRFTYYMAHGLDGALVGFLVSGFFVTVLYYPYFWINLSMTVALNGVVKNFPEPLKRAN